MIAMLRAGRVEEAIGSLERILGSNDRLVRSRLLLGEAYMAQGHADRAVEELNKIIAPVGDASPWLAYAYAVTGRPAVAREILDAFRKRAREQYVSPQSFAVIELGLGEKQRALASLRRAFEEHAIDPLRFSGQLFERLRDEPEYRELVRRLGLEREYFGS